MITIKQDREIPLDEQIVMIDNFISGTLSKNLGLCITDVLQIFMMCRNTYYNHKNSATNPTGRKYILAQEDLIIQKSFLAIIANLGYTPGARVFHIYMFRDYNMRVGVDRCNRLMKEMHLSPRYGRQPSHKTAKEPGTHCHICAAVDNYIMQDFYKGPRKVILTDITYLYIKEYGMVIYLCVFYDCFTKEALGWSVRKDMSTKLVEEAYIMMKDKHGELRGAEVYIHSDQGSQYSATTFKKMLEDDGFIQSMSQRGNSQDNAPIESLWHVTKERIQYLLALCPNFEVAQKIVNGYFEKYNYTYQFYLAGLSPVEFYEYTQTGVYPLENYFGVDASELDEQKKLIDSRIAQARKRNEKQREAYKKQRERENNKLTVPPTKRVEIDLELLERTVNKLQKTKDKVESRINFYEKVREEAKAALLFIENATDEIREELWDPLKWRCYPELNYVYNMNGLF